MPIQRGRKAAAASLTVLTTPDAPRQPPKGLTKPQIAVWRMVTATMPADFFGPDTLPLLVAYCRHAASMDLLAVRINEIEAAGGKDVEYLALLKARAQESATLLRLAQAQRLTQHSRYRAEAAVLKGGAAKENRKPWQAAGG